jgi:hypothetical protein
MYRGVISYNLQLVPGVVQTSAAVMNDGYANDEHPRGSGK